MAEARTTVTAATVLGHCLCCHHLVVVVAHHCPLLSNFPLCAIILALAALAIFLIPSLPLPLPSLLPLPLLAHHPCHHCHHLAALTLFVTHSLHWPLSLLSPAAVVAAPITLIVTCPPPALPLPLFLPLSLSPLSLLATLITVAIILFVTSAFTHLPPLLLSRRRSGGGGEDHTNPAHDPTLAVATGAVIIVTAFANRATGQEGLVKQCAGIQRPAVGMCQSGGAAVFV
jgi:hypothetical protein